MYAILGKKKNKKKKLHFGGRTLIQTFHSHLQTIKNTPALVTLNQTFRLAELRYFIEVSSQHLGALNIVGSVEFLVL